MPLCSCGKTLADLRSAGEEERWAERLDVSWGVRENGTGDSVFVQAPDLSSEDLVERPSGNWEVLAAGAEAFEYLFAWGCLWCFSCGVRGCFLKHSKRLALARPATPTLS